MDAEGQFESFKTRLGACGNEQNIGSICFTFAVVMDMSTVKNILALATLWGVPAQRGDVQYAYVQANKENGVDISLHVPGGMEFTSHELSELAAKSAAELVLRLKKTLYGLKLDGRLWSQFNNDKVYETAFERCITDMCLYYNFIDKNIIAVGVYVNDLLVTLTRAELMEDLFQYLGSLAIKKLGAVKKFLGMHIHNNDSGGYDFDQGGARRNPP